MQREAFASGQGRELRRDVDEEVFPFRKQRLELLLAALPQRAPGHGEASDQRSSPCEV